MLLHEVGIFFKVMKLFQEKKNFDENKETIHTNINRKQQKSDNKYIWYMGQVHFHFKIKITDDLFFFLKNIYVVVILIDIVITLSLYNIITIKEHKKKS